MERLSAGSAPGISHALPTGRPGPATAAGPGRRHRAVHRRKEAPVEIPGRWPWWEAAAGLHPDPSRPFRVERILSGMVRDRCVELGLIEGQEVRCRARTRDEVALELSDGTVRRLELPLAWFVQVHPVREAASPPSS